MHPSFHSRGLNPSEKSAPTAKKKRLRWSVSEQQRFDADNEPLDPDRPAPEVAESLPPIGNYDLFWRDDAQFIPTIDGEFRTSAIIDPLTGDYRRFIRGRASAI